MCYGKKRGIDIEYFTTGLVGVARNEQEMQDLRKKWEWAQSLGQKVEWLTLGDLREVEPMLSESLLGGIYIPGDHQVNSFKVTKAFSLGAKMREMLSRSQKGRFDRRWSDARRGRI
ncbi:NAD(P)/FAD-dependent oxidoreductase [Effusibacillus lacus]|nr:FAD dependent oxidoreductase [Effusibacillus lacus]